MDIYTHPYWPQPLSIYTVNLLFDRIYIRLYFYFFFTSPINHGSLWLCGVSNQFLFKYMRKPDYRKELIIKGAPPFQIELVAISCSSRSQFLYVQNRVDFVSFSFHFTLFLSRHGKHKIIITSGNNGYNNNSGHRSRRVYRSNLCYHRVKYHSSEFHKGTGKPLLSLE